jgi:hypothetical protein
LTDRHVRILELVARHGQRRLDDHDAKATEPTASEARRHDLATTATRMRARVAAAKERRRSGSKA